MDLRGSFLWLTPIKAGLSSSVSAHFKCQRCPDSGRGPNKPTDSDSIHSVHSVLRGLLLLFPPLLFCAAQRRDACDRSKCESLSLAVLLSILGSPGCDSPPPQSRQLVEFIILLPTPNRRFASYKRYNTRIFNVILSRYEICTIIRKSKKIYQGKSHVLPGEPARGHFHGGGPAEAGALLRDQCVIELRCSAIFAPCLV